MDEMRLCLSTKFMRDLVAKLISKIIFKQLGSRVDVDLKEIEVTYSDGKACLHTNIDLAMSEDEFVKLVKSATGFK